MPDYVRYYSREDSSSFQVQLASMASFDEAAFRRKCQEAASDYSLFDDPEPVLLQTIERALDLIHDSLNYAASLTTTCGDDGSVLVLWQNGNDRVLVTVEGDGSYLMFAQGDAGRVNIAADTLQIARELERRFYRRVAGITSQAQPTILQVWQTKDESTIRSLQLVAC